MPRSPRCGTIAGSSPHRKLLGGSVMTCRRAVALTIALHAVSGRVAQAQTPSLDRIFIIVFENRELADIVNNPDAPYLNSLMAQYGLATGYTAIQHPSMPNYMALTGGEPVFSVDCDSCTVDAPN